MMSSDHPVLHGAADAGRSASAFEVSPLACASGEWKAAWLRLRPAIPEPQRAWLLLLEELPLIAGQREPSAPSLELFYR